MSASRGRGRSRRTARRSNCARRSPIVLADLLIDKHLPGSFTGTGLQEWLDDRHIDHVTIVGYMTNVCCDTTARQALHLGIGATLLHDAVGVPTMPGIDGRPIDAETLQGAALAPLALIGVELVSTAEWVGTAT